MLKKYIIKNHKIEEENTVSSEQANILLYINPVGEEKKYLTDVLEIDEHTLASAMDPEELPRFEIEPKHITLILNRPRNYSDKEQLVFRVASMGLFLSKEKLIIVLPEEIPLFIGKRFNYVADLNEVFLKIIYNAIAHYLEHLRVINLITEEIEDKMTQAMDNKYLLNLFSLEKSLVYYASAITANGLVFEKLQF